MASNSDYQGDIYIAAGSSELVIKSSGLVSLEGTLSSTGTMTVASGGVLSVSDGGKVANPVTSMATTSGTITNYGISTFGTTIAGLYTLADPDRAGLRKTLACTVHGATTVSQIVRTATTVCTIAGTSNGTGAIVRTLTFTDAGSAAVLESLSTAAWLLVSTLDQVALTS